MEGYWIKSSSGYDPSFLNWASNEPNGATSNEEDCAVMENMLEYGDVYDVSCDSENHVVCEV